ncbi:hypothetical protein Pla110_33320 [Polystyrenella longa]|uniref:Uncharacterized protein n=2 Tax=Polystyrenella longa TaxID=2528007 RepID=A0A518CQV5_9PLAN|nr:hypothetical protein Pla110_33320 [Polystyrenella longa]
MRLTLRTLLAYLDDVLDANHTREIGKKLQESPYAANLVERIKKVTRQRRLMAPDVEPDENHLDANKVAEYLDNTLSPEEITVVEKVCLESDVQLAEVAASHQVLTLILGEPVDISSETRNRMYKIVPHAPAKKPGAASGSDPAIDQHFMEVTKSSGEFRLPPMPQTTAVGKTVQDKEPSFKEELPEYLRNQSSSRSRIPLIGFCVTLLLFIGLLAYDQDFWEFLFNSDSAEVEQTLASNEPVTPDSSDDEAAGSNDAISNEEPPAESSEDPSLDDPMSTPALADTESEQTNPDESVSTELKSESKAADPTTLASKTEPTTDSETDDTVAAVTVAEQPPIDSEGKEDPAEIAEPAMEEPNSEPGVELATAPIPPTPESLKPEEPKPTSKPAIPPARVLYSMQEGIVIQYQGSKEDWYIMPHRAVVHPEELLASPLPFDATFDIEQGEVRIILNAGTRIQNLPPSEVAQAGIKIERGQVIVSGGSALEVAGKVPYPLAFGTSDATWRVELMTPDTRFGIEILPKLPYEITPEMGATKNNGMLFVHQGSVRFADGDGHVQMVNANQALSLKAEDIRNNAPPVPMETAGNSDQKTIAFPDWLNEESKRDSMSVRKAKLSYEKLFSNDQSVKQSMSPQIINKNPIVASWAVDSLGHAGDIHSLVQALTTPDQPLEVIQMAKRHLREWLVQDPVANNEELQLELEAALSPEDMEVVTLLLFGINADQADDAAMSQQIVGWMDHSLLAVRDMAFELATHYTDRQLHYRPDASEKNRQSMILRWQAHLEKNEGKLAP